MNRWITTSGLACALALPLLIAPGPASASCNDRKVTGTVVGGVGGALIGNSIARGGGGAVLGGLGGAVLGHEVARSTCRRGPARDQHAEYHRSPRPAQQGREAYPPGPYEGDAQAPPQRIVYYDNRGNVIDPGATDAGPPPSGAVAYQSACRIETQSYYNDRGELTQYPVQTCAR